jgi:formate dehydrogenase major subunit
VQVKVRVGDDTSPGSVFMAFCFREAAANLLTTDALDPVGKIPEYKFCAVRLERLASPVPGTEGNG